MIHCQLKSYLQRLTFLCVLIQPLFLFSQGESAPANLAAALTVKMVSLEKNISSGGDVTIFVLGAPEVATELQTIIGSAIGNAKLTTVLSGDTLPEQPPSLLFVGPEANIDQVLAFTHDYRVLSVTATMNLVDKGVTLGIGVGKDGKPVIKLNLTSTIEESVVWNPVIMKIAKTVK